MKCEDCNIEMDYLGTKEMVNKVWDKYKCPKCKLIINKETSNFFKSENHKES